MAPWLAEHADVNCLDLSGATELEWASLQESGAETLKRVITPLTAPEPQSLERIRAFTEVKTIWHTKALG
jgi:hypothetical protein